MYSTRSPWGKAAKAAWSSIIFWLFIWKMYIMEQSLSAWRPRIARNGLQQQQWGLCALRHDIQISKEGILACYPARSTEWLDCHPKSCELWRIRTGHIRSVMRVIRSCVVNGWALFRQDPTFQIYLEFDYFLTVLSNFVNMGLTPFCSRSRTPFF